MEVYRFNDSRNKKQNLLINATHLTVITKRSSFSIKATDIADVTTELTKRKRVLNVSTKGGKVYKFFYSLKLFKPPGLNAYFNCYEYTKDVLFVSEKIWELIAKN